MADPLLPLDVIAGAAVRDRPNVFVLGCYDRRITFYAQQVRALSLIHALSEQGYLKSNPRIAVVGAGAAGMTAAAAAALLSGSQVVLFDSAAVLLSLQSTTERRNLDPHIYDWPAFDTTDPVADLPILDWEAGTCRAVRDDVVLEFEDIAVRVGGRLERRMRHHVDAMRQVGAGYELIFTDLDAVAAVPAVETSDRFDMVLLAIGFGLEPHEAVENIQDRSYWSDAGVPVAEFQGRPNPRFFISGNGDGGLIDFVAAGAMNFNHAAMIRLIADHPGVEGLSGVIGDIDGRARQADAQGDRFDFIAAYDAELLPQLTAIGLVAAVRQQLRPGVRLTLQTQHAEMFEITTSALNRVAAYLTIKACAADPLRAFRHIQCAVVQRVPQPVPCPEPAPLWLDCEGVQVGADAVIVRRGPLRANVRQAFAEHLATFEATHKEWLARHGDATLIPKLSRSARTAYTEAARAADVPLSRRMQRHAAPHLPIAVQIRRDGNRVRWSGAVAPQALVRAWSENQIFEIILPDAPADLGPAAGAILRVACHAQNARLHAMPALWRDLVSRLSVDSPHAEGMTMPTIVAGNPGGAAQDPEPDEAPRLARRIHDALDSWVLGQLNDHLGRFLASGEDPGRRVNIPIAPDLRQAMAVSWAEWRVAFEDDPTLLSHFLRLMVCAVDDADDLDVAQILVGPTKLPAIVRGTAVSLAIATAWQTTGPKGGRPGNLFRRRGAAIVWAGHGCAADLIDGSPMSLCAASYMWRTQFVILTVPGTVEVARSAERAFAQVETQQPSLSETDGSGPVMMWISQEFKDAVAAGTEPVATLLAAIEARHFAALEGAILKEVVA